jgi:hypothetical protein
VSIEDSVLEAHHSAGLCRGTHAARRTLVAFGALQLAAGLVGHMVAVRGAAHPFDLALIGWRERPERVARDAMIDGQASVAPVGRASRL